MPPRPTAFADPQFKELATPGLGARLGHHGAAAGPAAFRAGGVGTEHDSPLQLVRVESSTGPGIPGRALCPSHCSAPG